MVMKKKIQGIMRGARDGKSFDNERPTDIISISRPESQSSNYDLKTGNTPIVKRLKTVHSGGIDRINKH
jgi:hypothetical protein